MNRFNRSPSTEYRAFVETVQEYADADQEPGEGVRRAIADALSDDLRERFKAYWEVETIGEGNEPPHKPPHADHSTLWLDEDDEPAVFSMHVNHPEQQSVSKTAAPDPDQRQRNGWFDIVQCAEHWGLELAVMPVSWYNAMSTVNIVFYPPER